MRPLNSSGRTTTGALTPGKLHVTSLPSPDIGSLLDRAAERHAACDLAAAGELYRRVLALVPEHAGALAGMGAVAGQSGQAAQAVAYLTRACALEPANAIFHHNHGEALRQSGKFPEAEAAFRRALELDRSFLPALESLIALVQAAHQQAVAHKDATRAHAITMEWANLANNQGNALLARGRPMEALHCYRQALSLRADYAMAWCNLGNVLRDLGQISEADSACRRAVALDPALAPAWNNLGNALIEQGRFDEAAPCYERALALQPDFAQALHNQGSGSLFNRLYLPALDHAQITALHRRWGEAWPAPRHRRWHNSRAPDRILRVGYLSADFREHAMLHFIEPLLARHDASRVEVVCYAQGPGADACTRRLIGYGHRWNWVHGLDDAELALQIERDAIDILVDCAGHTQGTRITALAGKPAPLMMSWLGYLCSTGLPAMDYRLTDAWVDPPGPTPALDTEAVLRIPGGMLAYRPHDHLPDPGPPPCLAKGHVSFGSLNNIHKLNPSVIALWAQLLQRVPQATLLLQSKLLADAGTVGRVRGMFEVFGIAPSRLDLRPASRDFLLTYRDIDIALDTLPYGGGATTCDALCMGVPVVTLVGGRPAGRLSSSLLQLAGHPEWIASTPDSYLQTAIGLARQTDGLVQTRSHLRGQLQASALCDETGFVRRLESVYRAAWQRWLATGQLV